MLCLFRRGLAMLRSYLDMYKSPLTIKVLLGVLLGIIVIEAILLVPSYNKREIDLLQVISERTHLIADTIMTLEDHALSERMTMIEKGSNIQSVHSVAVNENLPLLERYQSESGWLDVIYAIPGEKNKWLIIKTDASGVKDELSAYVLRIIGLILIISAFVTFVTMIILGQLLIKPLLRLTQTLSTVTDGSNFKPIESDILARRDELGDLAKSYASLSDKVAVAFSEIEVLARFPYENPNPILRCTFDNKVMYRNPTAEDSLIFFADEQQCQLSLTLIDPLKKAIQQNQSLTIQLEGEGQIFSVSMVPFPEHNYVNLYARDITSQVEAERSLMAIKNQLEDRVSERTQELKRRESQLMATISSSLDAIVIMDHDGNIIEFNSAAESTFGYQKREVVGQCLSEYLIPSEYREAHDKGMQRYLATGSGTIIGQRVETKAKRKNGAVFPIESAMEVAHDGENTLFVSFMRDITERKEQENALIQAKDDAEKANKAKSDFLATMSHEIRTPMNGVIGMTSLLQDTDMTEEQDHFVQIIKESGESLLRLINDILDYTKIEVGKLELEEIPFDLIELCESVVSLMAGKAHEKHLEFGSIISPDIEGIYSSDSGRIRQVLLNLVNNAIKFTPEGTIVLRVYGVKSGIQFEIEDSGIGIDESHMDRLFKRFSQVDASTTRQYGGTGLGLAICKLIVETLGGTIGVNSQPGQGSTFWFNLPLTRIDMDHIPELTDVDALERRQVLLVEDNKVNREIFEVNLLSWGVHYQSAASVDRALELVAQQRFDLIILDLNLPDRDGYNFVEVYSQLPEEEKVPIILASSADMIEDSMRDHIAVFVMKPIRQKVLKEHLANFLALPSSASVCASPLALKKIDPIGEREKDAEYINKQKSEEQNMGGQRKGHALGDASGEQPKVAGEQSKEKIAVLEPVVLEPVVPRLNILVAEDNLINQMVAKGCLEKLGHSVDFANDGNEAISAVETQVYDLVFMDIQMPECDGYQATRTIRAQKGTIAEIPIIAMTANAMRGDREKALLVGMNDYIAKPVSTEKISTVIQQLFMAGADTNVIERVKAESTEEDSAELTVSEQDVIIWSEESIQKLSTQLGSGLENILQSYQKSAQERIEKIQQAIMDDDLDTLKAELNVLKRASKTLGVCQVYTLAEIMELQTLDCDQEDHLRIIEALDIDALEHALDIFKDYAQARLVTLFKG
jgi:PAS domain S-box-containing protein